MINIFIFLIFLFPSFIFKQLSYEDKVVVQEKQHMTSIVKQINDVSETKNIIQDEQPNESKKTIVNVEQTTQTSISKQISTTTLQSSIIKKNEEETKQLK